MTSASALQGGEPIWTSILQTIGMKKCIITFAYLSSVLCHSNIAWLELTTHVELTFTLHYYALNDISELVEIGRNVLYHPPYFYSGGVDVEQKQTNEDWVCVKNPTFLRTSFMEPSCLFTH